jgi:hypothetical protein
MSLTRPAFTTDNVATAFFPHCHTFLPHLELGTAASLLRFVNDIAVAVRSEDGTAIA